jgi:hypothetical protein
MPRFLGMGNGASGTWTPGTTTHAPIDASCSGTAGSNSLSATNASFATGQRIFIFQARGTGVGLHEDNVIASYSTGTITTLYPLENTYTDSGASQAQVIVCPNYSGANIAGTLTGKAWDGDKGGLMPIITNGVVTISGTLNLSGKGYRGGAGYATGQTGQNLSNVQGYCGEGTTAASTQGAANAANGNGAGAGGAGTDGNHASGGSGGSNGTIGTSGEYSGGTPGAPGAVVGDATDAKIFMGGGGGGGTKHGANTTKAGAAGAGALVIYTRKLVITGTVNLKGADAEQGVNGDITDWAFGGGGAGGFVLIRAMEVVGADKILLSGGLGGVKYYSRVNGGNGGQGRAIIKACICSTQPTGSAVTLNKGGHSYCGGGGFIF